MTIKLDSYGRLIHGTMDSIRDPVLYATAIRESLRSTSDVDIEKRIAKYAEAFSRQYPSSDEVGSSQAIVYGLGMLQDVLPLYLLGRNGAAYSEMHAWLERTALDSFPLLITHHSKRADVLKNLMDRRTLADLCPGFEELKVWSAADTAFVLDLKRIRDGWAHKNADAIARYVNSGKPLSTLQLSAVVDSHDAAEAIVRTLYLLVRVSWFAKHHPDAA